MEADAEFLSRLQFAFTIGVHILFPTFTIGLAGLLAILEGLWLRTANGIYLVAYRFWLKLFALSFGMGVVTGVVLSYEMGANFSKFSMATGNVLGPLISFEVLTAFFLEAGFLGIMLFGMQRVGPRLHYFATIMVALGTLISSFWILAANSWMHTPAGFSLENGVFSVASWWEVIFNPSFPYRLLHMLNASYLTTTFVVAAICAWYLLRDRHALFATRTLKVVIPAMALLAPLQILLGDLHGLNTLEHQPIKVAAMEGHWETRQGAPLNLFAIPDAEAEENHFEVAIPRLGSLILTHSLNGELKGLKEVAREDRPYVPLVFFSFRIMIGIGMLMLLLAWSGFYLLRKDRLRSSKNYLRILSLSAPLGFIAVIAGWVTTEAGRQPWTVQGLMRTSESVSALNGSEVLFTLVMFVVVYTALLLVFLGFMWIQVRTGPNDRDFMVFRPKPLLFSRRKPNTPLSAS